MCNQTVYLKCIYSQACDKEQNVNPISSPVKINQTFPCPFHLIQIWVHIYFFTVYRFLFMHIYLLCLISSVLFTFLLILSNKISDGSKQFPVECVWCMAEAVLCHFTNTQPTTEFSNGMFGLNGHFAETYSLL